MKYLLLLFTFSAHAYYLPPLIKEMHPSLLRKELVEVSRESESRFVELAKKEELTIEEHQEFVEIYRSIFSEQINFSYRGKNVERIKK